MAERDTIDSSQDTPNTVGSLVKDFTDVGLAPGMTVIVHLSLSRMGWVCGGAAAVILALQQVLTPKGTLVMPSHSGDLSDPAQWEHPPVPASWWPIIRSEMPAFDVRRTPTRGIGTTPELFRHQDGVLRSHHPMFSFAAWGAGADAVTGEHPLDDPLGMHGPLGRVYQRNGYVLLIGVGHDCNTSLHLCEHLSHAAEWMRKDEYSPILRDGRREWKKITMLDYEGGNFAEMGQAFETAGSVTKGTVGGAAAILMRQRELVDFGTKWMNANLRPPE